jgi:hypothetical protein
MYFLEKLSGLGVNDGVQINAVFTQLFLIMGLWPCIYAALLIPSARSGNSASDHHTGCDGCLLSVFAFFVAGSSGRATVWQGASDMLGRGQAGYATQHPAWLFMPFFF